MAKVIQYSFVFVFIFVSSNMNTNTNMYLYSYSFAIFNSNTYSYSKYSNTYSCIRIRKNPGANSAFQAFSRANPFKRLSGMTSSSSSTRHHALLFLSAKVWKNYFKIIFPNFRPFLHIFGRIHAYLTC